ncbi:MAG: hypothetical protein KDH96_09665 [Candidatus Riesia sp.]|nr:hypothetical protein [Candidatus Riesia sp.]
MPVLKEYAEKCSHITEFGVNAANSTAALLAGFPQTMRSYDIQTLKELHEAGDLEFLLEAAQENNIDFQFINKSSVQIEIEPTDLLFIDTWHVYLQLIQELRLHYSKVRRYIIVHDTEIFKDKDIRINYRNEESPGRGLMTAINDFLNEHSEDWRIKKHYTNNNGLTILERIS